MVHGVQRILEVLIDEVLLRVEPFEVRSFSV